jgi:hypothetical protein
MRDSTGRCAMRCTVKWLILKREKGCANFNLG